MYGSATFTTVMSSRSMNVAMQTATRVHHLAMPVTVPGLDRQHFAVERRRVVGAEKADRPGDALGRDELVDRVRVAARLAGVSIIVGAITLQRTPSLACS